MALKTSLGLPLSKQLAANDRNLKHHKQKSKVGHWLVTPRYGQNRTFFTTKAMVEFIRHHHGSMISWISGEV